MEPSARMGIGSIIVGIASFLFMFGGFFASVVPVLGTVLAFGAPVLAIAGIVMGGIAMSRAKRDGQPTGTALAGIIVNGVSLVPALLVAVTCGLCNACFTASVMNPTQQQQWWRDGGTSDFWIRPTPPLGVDAGAPAAFDPTAPTAPTPTAPTPPSTPPGVPAPAFPPPPMPGDDPGAVADPDPPPNPP